MELLMAPASDMQTTAACVCKYSVEPRTVASGWETSS